ncbi:MAG: hypothetical protein JRI77_13635 [Deltaproteobacteria bacterium]|nr:hypothetical protein [Deltaproteobacteria bacterium]
MAVFDSFNNKVKLLLLMHWDKMKALRIVISIALVYYFLTLLLVLFVFLFPLYIDFPCSVKVSEDGCLKASFRSEPAKPEDARIIVFLTSHVAGAQGGGCFERISDTDALPFQEHEFRRDNENLVIDGVVVLGKGQEWTETKIDSFWVPWILIMRKTSIINRGVVGCYMPHEGAMGSSKPFGPALLITGSKGTYSEINYLGIAGFIVLATLFLYFRKR